MFPYFEDDFCKFLLEKNNNNKEDVINIALD